MRPHLLLLSCTLVIAAAMQAQPGSGEDLLKRLGGEGPGNVKIHTDSLLVANYYKLLVENSKIKGVPGYRIRIYSESGLGAKEDQQRVRARFLSLFPGIDAYYRYDEPYFKVYVGDCRTRSEALKLMDQVKKKFPNAILREDFINIQ
jgi:hypothetical protein